MIKVLHIITSLTAGGAQASLLKTVQNTKDKNILYGVISLKKNGIYSEEFRQSLDFYFECPIRISPKIIYDLFFLYRKITLFSPNIIKTWLYKSDMIVTILYFFMKKKPKLIWNIRCSDMGGRYDRGLNFIFIKVLSYLSKTPHMILYNSQAGINSHLKRGYSDQKTCLVKNGIDTNIFKPDKYNNKKFKKNLGIPENKLLIGIVARYDPIKGHSDFLKGISIFNNCHALIVGDGVTKSRELKLALNKLKLKEKVTLMEQQKNIGSIISCLDILVSTSYSEGFPTVIAEAMSCQTIVIATNVGDTKEILGEYNFLINPGDPQQLSERIKNISKMKNEIKLSLEKKLRKKIIDNYSLDKMIDKYENIYNSLS